MIAMVITAIISPPLQVVAVLVLVVVILEDSVTHSKDSVGSEEDLVDLARAMTTKMTTEKKKKVMQELVVSQENFLWLAQELHLKMLTRLPPRLPLDHRSLERDSDHKQEMKVKHPKLLGLQKEAMQQGLLLHLQGCSITSSETI